MLSSEEYVAAVQREGELLARTAEGGLDRRVPTCPAWTVADLVHHTGGVHRHKTATVRYGGTQRPPIEYADLPQPPSGGLLEWYREGLEELVTLLAAADPEAPAYSWAGDDRVAFWQRRMAHETLVHRVDAELSVKRATDVAPDLGADGADEFLTVFMPRNEAPYAGPPGVIVLEASDAHQQWGVRAAGGTVTVVEQADAEDVRVVAPGAVIDLILWRRRPLADATVTGDGELVRAFLAWNELD